MDSLSLKEMSMMVQEGILDKEILEREKAKEDIC